MIRPTSACRILPLARQILTPRVELSASRNSFFRFRPYGFVFHRFRLPLEYQRRIDTAVTQEVLSWPTHFATVS
jgi:hypothetical protein